MGDWIYVFAHVTAVPGKQDALRQALLRLVEVTAREPGFIRYDLHEHSEKPGTFAFYEIWADQHALDRHGNTAEMAAHSSLTKGWVESLSVQTFRKIND